MKFPVLPPDKFICFIIMVKKLNSHHYLREPEVVLVELAQVSTELVRERDHDEAARDGAARAEEVTHGASHLDLF